MVQSRADLVESVLGASWELSRLMRGRGTPELLELDLSMAQFKTLTVLGHEGPAPIGRVAEALGIGQATASHLVDRLVQADFAERTEDAVDRRRTLARLSPQGQEIFDSLVEGGMSRFHDLLVQLSNDELQALIRGLRALVRVAAMEQAEVPAGAR